MGKGGGKGDDSGIQVKSATKAPQPFVWTSKSEHSQRADSGFTEEREPPSTSPNYHLCMLYKICAE
jgi:hypothetical protein